MADRVRAAAGAHHHIELLGRRPPDEVLDLVGDALMLVMPSTWYETFGRTMIEAFSRATPVVASRLGAMQELVDDGTNGRLFTPGDAVDLARTIDDLVRQPATLHAMRGAARASFTRHYTAEGNYPRLLAIYREAIEHRHPDRAAANG
jgi:glycosyltransferase involved in cell wall biosynthesis